MLIVHNEELLDWLRPRYTAEAARGLREFLTEKGTFAFPRLPGGLFCAAVSTSPEFDYTGYCAVWVRDNVHIARALAVTGDMASAANVARGLMSFYQKHAHRLRNILRGEADPANVMQRPHVRFEGHTLEELPVKWAHAQNDALGAFLWLFSHMAILGHVSPGEEDLAILAGFVRYLEAIRYWEDEDSGHWEEARKIEASSIGTVVAGLQRLQDLMRHTGEKDWAFDGIHVDLPLVGRLIGAGMDALHRILPSECVQPSKPRRYDSALLYLAYPWGVVSGGMRDQIVSDVLEHLQGPFGIRRYLGDSYWCSDYKTLLAPEVRTVDVSEDMSSRDYLLKPGMEAQWCLFDPIVSIAFGWRYRETRDPRDLARQVHHLNRSLGQLTRPDSPFGPFRCPESYYSEKGRYVPNDVTPLLWTQANLLLALHAMEENAG